MPTLPPDPAPPLATPISRPPWQTFAESLEAAEAHGKATGRPCKVRMRWEVYDHAKDRYVLLRGSTYSYRVSRATATHLAEKIWRCIYVLFG